MPACLSAHAGEQKMKATWILIANASKAICFERAEGASDLTLLARFEDPLGRSKGIDLAEDRAGYEAMGRGHAGSAFSPHTDARTKEHDSFARQLAHHLNEAVAAHRCDGLAILASNPFLGEVKSHLDEQSGKALRKAVPVDLTSFSGKELARRIDEALSASM
jgi:protein required for attachment to host cells